MSLHRVSVKTVIDNRGGPRGKRTGGLLGSNKKAAPTTVTVRVPLTTQQRGTRKLIITPSSGAAWQPNVPRIDDTLIKALARAHRWKRMLEDNEFESMTELAKTEGVTESYLARILRLTLLSPRIVEAVLDGGAPAVPQLQQLVRPFSMLWHQQEAKWLRACPSQ